MPDDQIATIVTKRDDQMKHSVVAETPANVPDVKVIALPSWRIVLVRVARVYLQSLLGFLTAIMSGAMASGVAASSAASTSMVESIMPHAFAGQLGLAASMALAPSFMTLAMNALELLTRMDESRPQWRA